MKDLLFLVADKDMAEAIGGFLGRPAVDRVIGCRPFAFDGRRDIRVAAGQNDCGLYVRANELLRPYVAEYRHAVVIVDEEWDGSPGADAICSRLADHLGDAGWTADRCLGLVVRPEADVWLWSSSPHSATALGWASWDVLRPALETNGWLASGEAKPARPKEAAEWALKNGETRTPRSAALYRKVASSVSVHKCEDTALAALLEALRGWFPLEGA